MKTLQPLCVTDVGLAAGNVFGVPGIDQRHREPALFQDLVDRNPIDPGGFHDDRLDPALFEPVGQPMQIGGEGIERPDRFGIPVRAATCILAPMSIAAAFGCTGDMSRCRRDGLT